MDVKYEQLEPLGRFDEFYLWNWFHIIMFYHDERRECFTMIYVCKPRTGDMWLEGSV